MNNAYETKERPTTALIYCRVSSKKQTVEGTGLQSQEHRCLAHAVQRRYVVEKVFLESVSGGLDIAERPAMRDLLHYLDKQKKTGARYVVIFDDNKRFARQTEVHLKLRRELELRDARVEYLNFVIEDSPEGTFIDTMLAAQAQLEREQIGRQTRQKTLARLERGYWTFRAPVGYKYAPSKQGGKDLVIDEPLASIVKEALEGFASGRFATQAEVKRFLESQPDYPKDLPSGELRTESVARMMQKVLYAGYLEAAEWNVARRKANHQPLISLETFERIQECRNGNRYLPMRKSINLDFVMRGAVCCATCNHPYTSGWSKGKMGKKYPYYFCQQKQCSEYGKTIPRDRLEGDFANLLQTLQPTQTLFQIAASMFKQAWDKQGEIVASAAKQCMVEVAQLERDINAVVSRLMETTNARVITAYESRIEEMENRKLLLLENAQNTRQPAYSFRDMFELSMCFLSSPQKLWESGKFSLQRTLLKLVFSERLVYCRNDGYRTPKTTLPFSMLSTFCGSENNMVPRRRLELLCPCGR